MELDAANSNKKQAAESEHRNKQSQSSIRIRSISGASFGIGRRLDLQRYENFPSPQQYTVDIRATKPRIYMPVLLSAGRFQSHW